ncbi:hypothetical protein QAD02_007939 [Eretmocerus hayati]|uniref:Uncharacterized protein n=1 Tax=Eretmocerus hayati TaxID=131215 RepID=A0ACC2N5D2_9HYME|nr:hypothetical protein QAD02_007939 [Eretmocerus hayati]
MAKMPFESSQDNYRNRICYKKWCCSYRYVLYSIRPYTVVDTAIKRQASTSSLVRDAFVINTKGCQIPDLSPFEPSAMRYFDKVKPIMCEQGTHLPLIDSNNSAIFVNIEARDHYYNESESVDCCWRSFLRSRNEDSRVT